MPAPNARGRSARRSKPAAVAPVVLGFVCCVLLPTFITLIAPISVVRLERDGEHVSATVTRLAYMVVPYRTERLGQVLRAEQTSRSGRVERTYSTERGNHPTYVEGEATLILSGPGGTILTPVSPVNIDSVTRRAQAFIDRPTAEGERFLVVANWKVSVLAGGLFNLLMVLFVGGSAVSIGRWVARRAGAPR